MSELSPSAQAVLAAANGACCYGPDDVLNDSRWITAAALRAAADQVVPPALEEESNDRNQALPLKKMVEIRRKLNAIADELEAQ